MKKTLFFLTIILGVLLAWDFYNFTQEGQSLDLSNLTPVQLNSVSSATYSEDGLTINCDSTNDAFLIVPLPTNALFWKGLQIHFKQLQGIRSVEIFYKKIDERGFTRLPKKFVTGWTEDSFTWFIPPGEYGQLRIDFDGHQTTTRPVIHKIQVKQFSFFFACEIYLYILAIFIFIMLVLPGSLMYLISAKYLEETPKNNLLYLFSNSLIFYGLLYLFEITAIETGISPTTTVSIAFFLLLGGLFLVLKIRRRTPLLIAVFKKEQKAFIASIILVLISCMFISKFAEEPFDYSTVNHNTLDRLTIFSQFPGHDNQFQFINGKAIADDEPFSKYYGNYRLLYSVQDRGILPGVIYSVFRTFFTTLSAYIGGSYLTYTLVGLCMNVMVLLPLIVLFRRYFPSRYQNIFLLLLCLNTFVFPNFYFTWFKFSGAALFISGLLILLDSRRKVTNWFTTGLMFGLASGMHAGNALAIPPVFLWFVGLAIYEFGFWSRQVFVFPVALTAIFVLVNLPWSIVKALHFPDTHALIIEHYFPAKHGPTLGATIINFFDSHPLKTQLHHRMGNVIEGLRLTEFAECFRDLEQRGAALFIKQYNDYQFFYFMFSLVPLFCIGIVSQLISFFYSKSKQVFNSGQKITLTLPHEALTLFTLSMLTILGLVFIAYSDLPDLNHALPAGTILIIHTLLIGWILKSGRAGHLLMIVYTLFNCWRMITHARLFIFS